MLGSADLVEEFSTGAAKVVKVFEVLFNISYDVSLSIMATPGVSIEK